MFASVPLRLGLAYECCHGTPYEEQPSRRRPAPHAAQSSGWFSSLLAGAEEPPADDYADEDRAVHHCHAEHARRHGPAPLTVVNGGEGLERQQPQQRRVHQDPTPPQRRQHTAEVVRPIAAAAPQPILGAVEEPREPIPAVPPAEGLAAAPSPPSSAGMASEMSDWAPAGEGTKKEKRSGGASQTAAEGPPRVSAAEQATPPPAPSGINTRNPPPSPPLEQEQQGPEQQVLPSKKTPAVSDRSQVDLSKSAVAGAPEGTAPSSPPPQKPRIQIVYDLPENHPQRDRNAAGDATTHAEPPAEPRTSKADSSSLSSFAVGPGAATDTNDDAQRDEQRRAQQRREQAHREELTGVKERDVEGNGDGLAGAVEKILAALQLQAVKVVALDDLNQQLIEKIGVAQPRRRNAPPPAHTQAVGTDEEATAAMRVELAQHLYSLRSQVQQMRTLLDQREAAQEREKNKLAAELQRTDKHRHVTVEVVRAYEEEPVPYKKGPFRRARRRHSSSSSSEGEVRTAHRTITVSRSKNTGKKGRGGRQRNGNDGKTTRSSTRGSSDTVHTASSLTHSSVDSASFSTSFESDSSEQQDSSSSSTHVGGTRGGSRPRRLGIRYVSDHTPSPSSSSTVTSNSDQPPARSPSPNSRRSSSSLSRRSSTYAESIDNSKRNKNNNNNSSRTSPQDEKSGNDSDSSTEALFWKRRAAAAARQRELRTQQQQQQHRTPSSSRSSSRSASSSAHHSLATRKSASASSSSLSSMFYR